MLNRPYIICHMVMSIDGKVTGDFLYTPECATATEEYYRINREYRADAFACGSIINGAFQRESLVDELSLVQAPVIAGAESKPLFENSVIENYKLVKADTLSDSVNWFKYKKAK